MQITSETYLNSLTKTNHTIHTNTPARHILSPTSITKKRKAQDTQQPKPNEDLINDVESAIAKIQNRDKEAKYHPQTTDPNIISYKKNPKNITIDRIQLGAFHINSEPQTNQAPCYNRISKTNPTTSDKLPSHQLIIIETPVNTVEITEINKAPQQILNNQPVQLINRPKIHYAQDNQTPGPSATHTLAELREIKQALEQADNTYQT
ncbi:hypothetical protein CHS0354_026997 [Potamilus streckersoni]|uniref:Uncharacterized protein n=1 Tax=Potamilus streckersoni TaxID=2493646 RepID=A0AAE0SC53_9BIVA|nr:hypothetical protein CHS0354_026997 [Potamilus streckersoni]